MDVLRPRVNKFLIGMVYPLLAFNLGCQKKMQLETNSIKVTPSALQTVSLSKIILRIEGEQKKESKLAELDFNFYVSDLTPVDFESQKSEIRNLILIHFANSEFKNIPKKDLSIKDPKLAAYLNQFLSKGKIEESEYKLVRVY